MTKISVCNYLSFLFITINVFSHVLLSTAVSKCNDPCRDLNDCSPQLICLGGRCFDDPNAGTRLCNQSNNSSTHPPPPPRTRQPAPAPPSMMAPPRVRPPPLPRH
ncbi:hypothetical protein HRI_001323600 [Hibiscus trionum]|uniref:Uncharacterized protein n=1 Tax=Hibiscus trionum TaxID=183268 RepID=A0A9W7HFT4_HIBTR|nr:hypothetical protein HRI_001323600 [Hibiscus trionum]